jgi:hypothetical protein
MGSFGRRGFLGGLLASGAAAAAGRKEIIEGTAETANPVSESVSATAVDFRYAPRLSQATICFPDDSKKSLVGQAGDLRYGFAKNLIVGMEDFATVCAFSLAGMQDDRVVRQWLEAPHVPIVHTLIERPTATLELTAFATRHANEGRVDNVLMTILPTQNTVAATPRIHIRTCLPFKLSSGPPTIVVTDTNTNAPFLVAAKLSPSLDFATWWDEAGTPCTCLMEKPRTTNHCGTLSVFRRRVSPSRPFKVCCHIQTCWPMKRGNSGSSGGRLGVSLGTIQARMASS